MGTIVTVDVYVPTDPVVVEAVFVHLNDIEARFSPCPPESEMGRLSRGELTEAEVSPQLREGLALFESVRRTSGVLVPQGAVATPTATSTAIDMTLPASRTLR